MGPPPAIVGIVNLTEDSFSDGGRFLAPERAIARAHALRADGATLVELGPASSHPDAKPVSPEEEIARLAPVVEALQGSGIPLAIDSWQPATQRWALSRDVALLNDVRGFPDPDVWPDLARARAELCVVHSVAPGARAARVRSDAATILDRIEAFLGERAGALERAGIARERLVLDPGMGFFLGDAPEPSLAALRGLRALRECLGRRWMVSVSRKSFLGALTGRPVAERGAATLAAELFAAAQGVDYLRTHDVRALADALAVTRSLSE